MTLIDALPYAEKSSDEGLGLLELRTVLVIAPPLLADVIRSVVSTRFTQHGDELSVVTATSDFTALAGRLLAIDPAVVVIWPAGTAAQLLASSILPRTPVLTLSANLRVISGPGSTGMAILTPDSLAARLRDALRRSC
jgi:hypothetical protein